MNVSGARSWPVMLAESAPATEDAVHALDATGPHVYDTKWDGVRCLAVIEDGEITLHARSGEDITYRFPEVVVAMRAAFAGQSLVLDGEVIIFDPQTNVPMFKWLGHRKVSRARSRDIARWAVSHPATYVAFDVLAAGDPIEDCRALPQRARLELLDALVPSNARLTRSLRSDNGCALLQVVQERKLEGIIAKDLKAPYRAGRRSAWKKMKPTHRVSCLVLGVEKGEGWRADYFGALRIYVTDDAGLVDLGKVGSGFTVADLTLLDPFVGVIRPLNPRGNTPEAVLAAGRAFIVDVEYQERQPDSGVLRFPVFKGVRWDLTADATTVNQFDREA